VHKKGRRFSYAAFLKILYFIKSAAQRITQQVSAKFGPKQLQSLRYLKGNNVDDS